MRTLSLPSILLSLALVACSSGSSNSNAGVAPDDQAAVLVVVETRAGSDALVQFQLAGATLEGPAGDQTPNLLPESTILTVGDPTGEPSGLRLRAAPTGEYTALHLVFVPGSGIAIAPDGSSQAVAGPTDLRIPITSGLQHNQQNGSWLVIGHDSIPLSNPALPLTWNPVMTGRLDGASIQLRELRFPIANANSVAATATTVGNASLEVDCSAACVYEDDSGQPYPSRSAFLTDLSLDDDLSADGDLRRDGRLETTRLRRSRRSDQPRLIGSILAIDAATSSFTMQVVATRSNGNQVQLATPETAIIRAGNAIIEAASSTTTSFSSLAAGQMVKVKWFNRSLSAGTPEYTAREVELLNSSNTSIQPEWEARVQSIGLNNQVIVIVPRSNDPIIIHGVSVPQAEVVVSNTTSIERRQNQGGTDFPITLAEIQAGVDRIWIRGTAIGSAMIAATRIRVRQD